MWKSQTEIRQLQRKKAAGNFSRAEKIQVIWVREAKSHSVLDIIPVLQLFLSSQVLIREARWAERKVRKEQQGV